MWTSRSLLRSTRFSKSSGRTSLAIPAKSSGFLMSCLGKNAIPPFQMAMMLMGFALIGWRVRTRKRAPKRLTA